MYEPIVADIADRIKREGSELTVKNSGYILLKAEEWNDMSFRRQVESRIKGVLTEDDAYRQISPEMADLIPFSEAVATIRPSHDPDGPSIRVIQRLNTNRRPPYLLLSQLVEESRMPGFDFVRDRFFKPIYESNGLVSLEEHMEELLKPPFSGGDSYVLMSKGALSVMPAYSEILNGQFTPSLGIEVTEVEGTDRQSFGYAVGPDGQATWYRPSPSKGRYKKRLSELSARHREYGSGLDDFLITLWGWKPGRRENFDRE